jgi:two-component system chemotaxis response regulator CheY
MAGFEQLSVLVVDDEPAIRSLMQTMLRRMRVKHVVEAEDAESGLRHFAAADRPFDLVVCDWNMPGLSGIELWKRVRESNPNQPFLMVTGRNDATSITEAVRAGVAAYIVKPFSQKELEAKIAFLSSRRQAS